MLLALVLIFTMSLWPAAFCITSFTMMGPFRAAKLRMKVLVAGNVMVLGAAGDPRIRLPPAWPAVNPFEMKRLLVIVIGPANVRLLVVSPTAVSMANPVVNRRAFEIVWLPAGRRC